MSKYCGNCGAELDDSAKVCGQCGTPVEDVSTKIPRVKIVVPEKQKKVKKIVKLIIGLIVVILVAVITVAIILNFTGYKGLLRKAMNAYADYDINTLVSLSSDVYYYGDEDWVEYYFENSVGSVLDSFESTVGHSFNFSYEINEIYDMSKRNKDELINEIENTYPDFDINLIKEVVVVDLTVTATKNKESASRDVNVIMTKENVTWKILYIN